MSKRRNRRQRPRRQQPPASRPQANDDATVWVESGMTPEGTYFVGFTVGQDKAWALNRFDSREYAIAVLRLVARAEHDAAVLKMLTTLGVDLNHASHFIVKDLRPDRPDVKCPDAVRLGLHPSATPEGKPFLSVTCDGEPIGQWTLEGARGHAMHVLEACEVVDLDQALKRALVGQMELEEWRANAVVNDLRKYRHAETRT